MLLYHYSFLFFASETYHLPQLFDAIDLEDTFLMKIWLFELRTQSLPHICMDNYSTARLICLNMCDIFIVIQILL